MKNALHCACLWQAADTVQDKTIRAQKNIGTTIIKRATRWISAHRISESIPSFRTIDF
jgi:hypothetical protein